MKKLILLISCVTLFSMFTSCMPAGNTSDDGDKDKDPKYVTLNISGEVVDAATEDKITSSVSLTFQGPSKAIASEAAKATDGKLEITNGTVNFPITVNSLSELENIDFTIVANADKYISNSARVYNVTATDYVFKIKLTNINNTPSGVEVAQESLGSIGADGKTTTTETLETPTSAETPTKTVVTLPAGTIIKDADGNQLSGALTATVGHFSPKQQEALESFPGGFEVELQGEEQESDGFFVTGGFVSIDIVDENGKAAETFEGNDLDVKIDIPSDLMNPVTGETVKPGDDIPLWSYNTKTGEWKREATVTRSSSGIEENGGVLSLSFKAPHLSYWNIDWFNPGKVDKSRDIILDGLPQGAFVLKLDSGAYGFTLEKSLNYDGTVLNLLNVPSFPLNVTIYDLKGNEIGKAENVSLAGTDDLTIKVTPVNSGGSSGGASNFDFSTIGYQISFEIDGEKIVADAFTPGMLAMRGKVSKAAEKYYDDLRGDYSGPYCEIYTSGMVLVSATNTSKDIFVYGYFGAGVDDVRGYLCIGKLDQNNNPTEVTYFNGSLGAGSLDVSSDFTCAADGPVTGYKDTSPQTRGYSTNSAEDFKKQVIDKIKELESLVTRSKAPVEITNLRVKSKILTKRYWNNDENLYVRFDLDWFDELRVDVPIVIKFEGYDTDYVEMDTSIKTIIVNDVEVEGEWIAPTPDIYGEYDDPYMLVYTPTDPWPSNSVVTVDVPVTHKSLDGSVVMESPSFLMFNVGEYSISKPSLDFELNDINTVDLYIDFEGYNQNLAFEIWRSETEDSGYEKIADETTSGFHIDDNYIHYDNKNLVEGKTYFYKVKVTDTDTNNFLWSDVESCTIPAPQELTLGEWYEDTIPDTEDEDTLWYRASVEIGKSYNVFVDDVNGSGNYTGELYCCNVIYRNTSGGYTSSYLNIYMDENNFTIPRTFTATVDEVYLGVECEQEPGDTGGTFAIKLVENIPPVQPTNFKATATSASITLTWDGEVSDYDSFNIVKETEFSSEYGSSDPVNVTDFTYVDTEVAPGIEYTYELVAIKDGGYGMPLIVKVMILNNDLGDEVTIGTQVDCPFTEDYDDTGNPVFFYFKTVADTSYNISFDDTDYSYKELYKATGEYVRSLSSSGSITGDGGEYYIVVTDYEEDESLTIDITTP